MDNLLLPSTFAAVGILHTLSPEHWLPFTLAARARGWSRRKTAVVCALGALADILPDLLIGMTLVAAGETLVEVHASWTESLGRFSSIALIAFGLGYAVWGFWRVRSGAGCCPTRGCASFQGGKTGSERVLDAPAAGLIALSLLSPCPGPVALFPSLIGAAGTVKASALTAFCVTSVLAQILLVFGSLGAGRYLLRFPRLERYADAAGGLLVAGLGAYMGYAPGALCHAPCCS